MIRATLTAAALALCLGWIATAAMTALIAPVVPIY